MNKNLEEYLINLRWADRPEIDVPPYEYFCHYTSAESFLNIVQSDGMTLWASRIDCMNDASEWNHAINLYQSTCDYLLKQNNISERFCNAIRDVRPAKEQIFIHREKAKDDLRSHDIVSSHTEETDRFICCFSKEQDSLPMWNNYARSGGRIGYNLGLFHGYIDFDKFTLDSGQNRSYSFYKVIYEDSEKYRLMSLQIKGIGDLVQDEDDVSVAVDAISGLLNEWAITFKRKEFAYENEVRLVVDVPLSEIKDQLKYRTSNGLIVPYVEVKFPHQCLSSVKIGPLSCLPSDAELQKNIIQEMLALRGYKGVDISNSEIPIRF